MASMFEGWMRGLWQRGDGFGSMTLEYIGLPQLFVACNGMPNSQMPTIGLGLGNG